MSTADDLRYYLNRAPSHDEIAEADEWQLNNPGVGLSEWVDAMIAIGAL